MKKIKITLIFMSMVLLIQEISSRENEDNDQTLSPYFLVLGEGNETEQLPLESTSAKVKIAGIIADVEVNQVYRNNGSKPIEAIYVFPASSKAAVYGMKMIIGERTIVAKIKEKEEARKDYEEAKTQGKGASLLEQQRPNVFQMNVANIMPGDRIEISLKYTETLVPNKNTYQFIYPAVAGPRYEGKMSTPGNWVANPYTKEGEDPHYKFNIEVTLIAGMKIQSARCNSHETTINYKGSDLAHVQLKKPWGKEGNRDFILDYRLAGDGLESGILLFEGEKENFFLAMIHPPGRIDEEIIPAREYVFIIDVSGSMHGFPLSVSKEMMRTLLSGLKPMDRFNVLLFAGNSSVLSKESLPATPQNIEYAMEHINSRSGSGGTELIHALRRAFDLKSTENYSRSFVILTDGYVTVEKEAFDLIRQNLNNANFYPFGIGTSVNRYIIEGMARVGKTEPIVVTAKEEAEKAAIAFREYIKYPVLSRIKYSFEEFDAYDTEPFTVQDVLAERPVLLFGKYKGYPRGNITITGITGKGTFKKTIPISNSETGKNKALQYLWARERIRLLGDYARVDHDEDLKNEILQLGINYNLLTDYTSFVAIDSEVRNTTGTQTTVTQPLPLPAGVSNHAVGNRHLMSKSTAFHESVNNQAELSMDRDFVEYEEEDMIFFAVEVMPQWIGKEKNLNSFIIKNMVYPKALAEVSPGGTMIIQFSVDIDGTVKDIIIQQSIHPLLDAEVIRVIKMSKGMWKPGIQRGKPVKVSLSVPVKIATI